MFSTTDLALWIVTTLLPAAVAIQLYRRQLWHLAPWHGFFLMLLVGITRDLVPFLCRDLDSYRNLWEITLCALALPHAYAALTAYRSIERRAAGPVLIAIALSTAFAALLLPIETIYFQGEQFSFRFLLLLYRIVDGSLAILLLTAALQQLRRTPAHAWLLAAYFSSYAIVSLIKNQVRGDTPALNTWHMAFVAILYACWLLALPSSAAARISASNSRSAATLKVS